MSATALARILGSSTSTVVKYADQLGGQRNGSPRWKFDVERARAAAGEIGIGRYR